MMLRQVPDPVLRRKSVKIEINGTSMSLTVIADGQQIKIHDVYENIKGIAEDITRVMQEHYGLGLAASQIGQLVRMFVFHYEGKNIVILNPQLKRKKGKQMIAERCLSIPAKVFWVERSKSLTLVGKDLRGEDIRMNFKDIYAAIIEHEYDHLDGILIDKKGKLIVTNVAANEGWKLAWG